MKDGRLTARLNTVTLNTLQRHAQVFASLTAALEDIMTTVQNIGPLSFMTCYTGDGIPYRLIETPSTFVLMKREKNGRFTHAQTIRRAEFLRDYVIHDGAVYSSQMFSEIPQTAVYLASNI